MPRTKTNINSDEVAVETVENVVETEKKEKTAKTKIEKKPKTKILFLEKLRGRNANQQIFVSLNGRDYLIQRGVSVEVPIGVYEVVMNSIKAKDEAFDYIEGHAENY